MDGSRERGLLHLHVRELDVLTDVGRGGAGRAAAGLYPGLDELLVRARVRYRVRVRLGEANPNPNPNPNPNLT